MSSTREPNTGLLRLYRESGWTQRQFAQEINRLGTERGTPLKYRSPSVHQWLGGHVPREDVRPLILEAFARRLGHPVTHAEAGFPPPGGATGRRPATEGITDLGRQDMDPSRRGVLGASLFSVALTVPNWPDVAGRMEAVQTGHTQRVGMSDVDMVTAMTEQISALYAEFGGRHSRPMAAAFLVNTVTPYLKARAPEPVRKSMMSAASDLCYLAGHMAVDEGLHGLAQQYYVKALEVAGASEDHLTYCTTLRGMSVQAVDLGHGREALRLADAAAAAAPEAGPRMRAFLAGQQAHAAAQTGDRTSALSHLRVAEAALDKAESRERKFVCSYRLPALRYHTGQVLYALGDVRGSTTELAESDKHRNPSAHRTRVRYLSLLAERQLEIGHLETACATWRQVLDIYPKVQSGQCDQSVTRMLGRIRPYQKTPAARALYERARTAVPLTGRA
ncbi:tetratricopeptide repeat protein [Streptomyces armeniacus]|uniref:tetratricopeptide repeat protein n=1 Tax=Streptomyces armeniacus TaxID=83291 RepID=UPI001AD7FAFA|nr:tetratricopeptide repeat protein [Streptomyces armeniacus]